MRVFTRKKFLKQYEKLQRSQRESVDSTLALFKNNPHHPSLRNHTLKGKMQGRRSIAAGFDLRIIFKEEGNYTIVLMLAVGKHEEVYGN